MITSVNYYECIPFSHASKDLALHLRSTEHLLGTKHREEQGPSLHCPLQNLKKEDVEFGNGGNHVYVSNTEMRKLHA